MNPRAEHRDYHPKTRAAWRNWLEKNHASAQGIWFVYFKKESGKARVSYAEAVEEALCFGWIDSLPRKIDTERSALKFTPRKPKSVWSDLNKQRVARLIKDGQMTRAGQEKIDKAQQDGSWNKLNTSNFHADSSSLPEDLEKAFRGKRKALENFKSFAVSYRRQFLFWIDSAKQPATRAARVKQTVLMAAANKKPGLKGFKL